MSISDFKEIGSMSKRSHSLEPGKEKGEQDSCYKKHGRTKKNLGPIGA